MLMYTTIFWKNLSNNKIFIYNCGETNKGVAENLFRVGNKFFNYE